MDKLTLSFAGHTVDWSALPESSKAALATLGFSTKIKNSVAGVKKAVLGEGSAPWSDDDIEAEAKKLGLAEWGRNDVTADAIVAGIQKEMFDAIVSGISPSSRRGGPRLSDDDRLRQSIAIELFTAAHKRSVEKAKAEGRAVTELPRRSKPDEKAAFDALLAKALENAKFAAAVDKEFSDRKRKAAKTSDGLDELFA